MNPQNSLKQILIVPFVILLLLLGGFGVYEKNHYIMNPDPYLPHLLSGGDSEPLHLDNPHVEPESYRLATPAPNEARLSHRFAPLQSNTNPTSDVTLLHTKKSGDFQIDRGQIILGHANGIDVFSDLGQPLFQFHFESGRKRIAGNIITTDRLLILASDDGRIYALDRVRGEPEWIVTRPEIMIQAPLLAPLVNGPEILIFADGKKPQTFRILHLDVTTGRFIKETGSFESGLAATPLVSSDGHLFYATTNGHINVVSLDTGRVLWTNENAAGYRSQPALTENHLFAVSEDGMVFCFDRIKGKKIWELPLDTQVAGRVVTLSSVGIGGVIDAQGSIYAFDLRSGKKLWRHASGNKDGGETLSGFRMDNATYDSVSIQNETRGWAFWAGCGAGDLCIYEPKQGALLHRIDLHGRLTMTPQISLPGETIWVPTTKSDSTSDVILRGYRMFKPTGKTTEAS